MTAANKPEIDISVQEPEWDSPALEVQNIVNRAVGLTLDVAILPRRLEGKTLEISVVLANDDLVQVLNRTYRGMDKPTNVLSFATLDSETPHAENENTFPIGDVIVSYQTIDREAREQGKYFRDHFIHMMVHGTLHLLGYDHQNEDDANIMETLEIRILEKMNIQNPYMDGHSMA